MVVYTRACLCIYVVHDCVYTCMIVYVLESKVKAAVARAGAAEAESKSAGGLMISEIKAAVAAQAKVLALEDQISSLQSILATAQANALSAWREGYKEVIERGKADARAAMINNL